MCRGPAGLDFEPSRSGKALVLSTPARRVTLRLEVPMVALAVYLLAAADPFVGAWKLNAAKTKLSDQMKVESVGGDKYAFDLGGGPETIVTDGTDQPGYGDTTLSVTVEGPNAWRVVRKKDGRMLLTAEWRLSQDGNTLTDDFTSINADGARSKVAYVYARTAGTSGFAGTWESTSEKIDSIFVIHVQPYEADGLALTYSSGAIKNLKFDGDDRPSTGADATAGVTFSARRTGPRSLELTDKLNGKVVATEKLALSSDGRTLTQTVLQVGRRTPNVLVFDRQ
jgi:hypothetical protein